MKYYDIRKLNNSCYDYLIFSTSYVNPLECVNDIESSLKENNYSKVLFDLLLSNGNSTNRFIEATFDGRKLENFQTCENVDIEIKRESGRYYQDNNNLLKNSVLSRPQKFLVSKGKIVL